MLEAAANLKDAETALHQAQAKWKALCKQHRGGRAVRLASIETAEESANGDAPENDSLPNRVVAFFVKGGNRGVAEIAKKLNAPEGSVRSALYVLRKRGQVERVGKGLWAAKEETAS